MEGRATKRYATLAALTLALGGAVFLNWSFAGRTPQAGTPEAVVQTSAEADEEAVPGKGPSGEAEGESRTGSRPAGAGGRTGGETHGRSGSV